VRKTLAAIATTAVLAVAAAPAAAEPTWKLQQPDPPAGAQYKVPLGAPGDLSFFAPNRGLLAVEGNETVPRGLLYWDGVSWRQLTTVCGGPGDTTRIVWAGPTEFWTITEPSRPRSGPGRSLCRFANGEVVASYSTSDQSPDPFRQMAAGACNGPSDCWFAGVAGQDANGERIGGFHLHWDGQVLRSVYAPQGRAVTDLVTAFGGFWESTVVGGRPESDEPALLAEPEKGAPKLIQVLQGANFVTDNFQIPFGGDTPPDGTELLSLGRLDTELWAVGGGAASGPSRPATGIVERPPFAALRTGDDGFRAVPLDPAAFKPQERLVDVAPSEKGVAWGALQAFGERRSTNARARVARMVPDGTASVTALPASGSGRGAAARIAFPAPNEGWMVTTAGWLFHYTDGTPLAQDTEPAFQKLITFRPNEAAEQFVPDDPPEDDSQLFAPPPVQVIQQKPPKGVVKRLKPLLRRVRTKRRGLTLTISFILTRKAKVGMVAKRKGKVVARARTRSFRPGRHALTLKLNRKRYPTALKFITREKGAQAPDDDETVTT